MKKRFLVSISLFLVIVSSCKDEKKTEEKAEPVKENFSVELDVVVKKNDDFTVYYTETGTNEFDGTKAVWGGVSGGNIDEKVLIELPEEIVPTNIRVDFGIKPEREDVVLKKITLIFHGKRFEIKGSDFLNYFIVNDKVPTETDGALGTIKFLKTPENKEGTYFYPRQELLDKIAELTGAK
ncbi:hypothetical protein [Flavobacterium sp.]|jgi:hypothetical protein|uniref:hypothetical protein n=1 Tax=Flavobacterium sp. TaxID=239 RepID=UPI0037C03038